MARFLLLPALAVLVLTGCTGQTPLVPGPAPTTSNPLAATVIQQTLTQRSARVTIDATPMHGNESIAMSGVIEYSPAGPRADLTGTIDGDAIHVIIAGHTIYVSQYFKVPSGKTWEKLTIGGARRFYNQDWALLDLIATTLTHAADATLLQGLAYIDAPPEKLDGHSVRSSMVTVTRERLVQQLPQPGQQRFDDAMQGFSGARLLLYLDEQTITRRLITTITGMSAYPTVDIHYTDWTTPVTITEPPAPSTYEPTT